MPADRIFFGRTALVFCVAEQSLTNKVRSATRKSAFSIQKETTLFLENHAEKWQVVSVRLLSSISVLFLLM